MKTCEIVRDLLPLYIDDVCSDGSRELIEEHLKICKDCEREYKLMKYPASAEEKTGDFAAVEEEILKAGKERIEDGVKQKIMNRLLWLDIFSNIFFLSLGVGIRDLFFHATKLPWYGKFLTYEELNQTEYYHEFMQYVSIITACVGCLLCNLITLYLKRRKRWIIKEALSQKGGSGQGSIDFETALEYIMMMSLFIKFLYVVIMTVIGFLYLYSELESLCG